MAPGLFISNRPMLFHEIHGEHVALEANNYRARRADSFCKALAFGSRPLEPCEVVCLKFAEVGTQWSGVLRIGVTNSNPEDIQYNLPKYACPDLTQKPGNWAKALTERHCVENSYLHIYILPNGDMHFGVNAIEKGVFLSGIDVSRPLWILVDIYGNSRAIEFVDPRNISGLNNLFDSRGTSISTTPTSDHVLLDYNNVPDNNRHFNAVSQSHQSTVLNNATAAREASFAAVRQASANRTVDGLTNSMKRSNLSPGGGDNDGTTYHAGVPFERIQFNPICGKNIRLSTSKTIATRLDCEYENGYVFSARTVGKNNVVVIQVLRTHADYVGSLAFGLTTCNPAVLPPESLPNDSDALLDRPEYWLVLKDVANPVPGDELGFYVAASGEVFYYKNNGKPHVIMHVDNTQCVYMFFDVYGSTVSIKLLGKTEISCLSMRGRCSVSGSSSSALPIAAVSPIPSSGNNLRVNLPPAASKTPSRSENPISTESSSSRNQPRIPPQRPPPLPSRSVLPSLTTVPPAPVTPMSTSVDSSLLGSEISIPPTPRFIPSPVPPPRQPEVPSSPYTRAPLHQFIGGNVDTSASSGDGVAIAARMANCLGESVENIECVICMEAPRRALLYPCAHLVMCYKCALQQRQTLGSCPVCRQAISDIITPYMA